MSTFLTAEWRKLIMAQYEIAPDLLTPYLPHGVELDLFDNRCFVSLVGFLFDRVRVKGIAFPLHTRFPEVNLRFYVRRTEANGERRRGVVFISELVPRRAIAVIARRFYEEPYAAVPMGYSIETRQQQLAVSYRWHIGRHRHVLSATADPVATPIAPASVEEFITEHYWGYTKRSDGSTSAYPVQHPRWDIYPLRSVDVRADFGEIYGPRWAFLTTQRPANALLAEGSAVTVATGTRLPQSEP